MDAETAMRENLVQWRAVAETAKGAEQSVDADTATAFAEFRWEPEDSEAVESVRTNSSSS